MKAGPTNPKRQPGGSARAWLSHPIPALLVGIGLTWVTLAESHKRRPSPAPAPADRAARSDQKAGTDSKAGHDAAAPTDIPARGWKDVLWRVMNETSEDHMSLIAAGCAFYALLALFPGITALVSLYGLVADPATVEQQMTMLKGVVPQEAFTIIENQAHSVASGGSTVLGWSAALAILLALYSASSGVSTVFTALNIAYEEQEERGLVRFYLTALAFTLAAIVGIAIVLTVMIGVPAVLHFLPLGPLAGWGVRIVSWLIGLAVVVVGIAALYRFGPSRAPANWRWLTPGSIAATILWLIASIAFSYYAANFASYNQTYGTLGGVIILLMWLWISAFVVLLGAELNSELELQTDQDTTTGAPKPEGQRNAYVADHTAGQRAQDPSRQQNASANA